MEKQQLVLLVNRAKAGDPSATNQLFSSFYDDVYYFALKTVKDSDTACDITQETFLEIIRTIDNLNEPAAFVTWMRRIAYHQCTRYFKKKRDVLVDEDEDGNTVFDTLEDEDVGSLPVEVCEKEDFRNTILSIINELNEEQRSAVLMYYFDEMSVSQIAQVQGVSEGTVKSRLNYARKAIRKSVEDYEKKNGIKLHAIAFFPLFRMLYPEKVSMPAPKANVVRNNFARALSKRAVSGTITDAGRKIGEAVAKKTVGSIATKVVSLLAVATIVISGAFAVTQLDEKLENADTSMYNDAVYNSDSVEQFKTQKEALTRDPEAVAESFMSDGFVKPDAKKIVALLHQPSLQAHCKQEGITVEQFESRLQSQMDDMEISMNSVAGTIEWNVNEVRACTGEEQKTLKQHYKNLGADIQECQVADCVLTAGVLGFGVSDIQEDVSIIKIDGIWYLDIEEVNWIG